MRSGLYALYSEHITNPEEDVRGNRAKFASRRTISTSKVAVAWGVGSNIQWLYLDCSNFTHQKETEMRPRQLIRAATQSVGFQYHFSLPRDARLGHTRSFLMQKPWLSRAEPTWGISCFAPSSRYKSADLQWIWIFGQRNRPSPYNASFSFRPQAPYW